MDRGSDRHLMHGVLFYDSDEEFLATVAPFVRTALEFDERVILACQPRTQGMLNRELAEDRRIAYLAYDDVYTTPGAAIATYRELLDGYLAAGVEHGRVVGDAAAHSDRETRAEWGRYEAVVNDALQSYPVSALCTYDTRAVSEDALAYGRLTHPVIVRGGHTVTNPGYVSPADYLRRTTRVAPDPLESTEPDLAVDDVTSLDAVRGRLKTALTAHTHAVEPAADFLLAVNEVTTNAVRHGHPPYRVRVWLRPDRFLATVTDRGRGFDDPFAGYEWPGRPHGTPTGGMGLWLARRLCDRVDMFRGPDGVHRATADPTQPTSPPPHHAADPATGSGDAHHRTPCELIDHRLRAVPSRPGQPERSTPVASPLTRGASRSGGCCPPGGGREHMDDHDPKTCEDRHAPVPRRLLRDHIPWHDELDAQIRQVVRDGIDDWQRAQQLNLRHGLCKRVPVLSETRSVPGRIPKDAHSVPFLRRIIAAAGSVGIPVPGPSRGGPQGR